MGPLWERHPIGNRRVGSSIKLARGVNGDQVSFRSIRPGIGSNRGWCINGCSYIPTFEALSEVIDQLGGHNEVVVVGDPGCMVRAQLPSYEIMDVKHSLGPSIGIVVGISLGFIRRGEEKRVVALCGDSGFFYTPVLMGWLTL